MEHGKHYLFQYSNFNLMINPNEYGISLQLPETQENLFQKLEDYHEIYNCNMAATQVNRAYDREICKNVAVKTIFKELLFDDLQKKQAAIEFPIQCSLHHPNLVKGYDYTETDKKYVGILEYVSEPEYLKEKIDENLNNISNENKLKSYILDILEGMNYLHDKGIIHSDIKLENILAEKEEGMSIRTLKLCDFGLVQLLEDGYDSVTLEKIQGTSGYMAPELPKLEIFTLKL